MSKKIVIIFFCFLVLFPVCAADKDSIQIFFPLKQNSKAVVYPVEKKLGLVASSLDYPVLTFFKNVFSEEFSPEWVQKNMTVSCAKAVNVVYGRKISQMLPVKSFVFSVPVKNADGSFSFEVCADGIYISAVALDNKIIYLEIAE